MSPKTKVRRKPRNDTITGQIRAIIDSRRLTAYSVATDAGINPSILSRFLTGERTMSADSIDAVCATLGLKLTETRRGRGSTRRDIATAVEQNQGAHDEEI